SENCRKKWEKIVEFGLAEAGVIFCDKALQTYSKLIDAHNIPLVLPIQKTSLVYSQFAEQTMKAFDTTINSYLETTGFWELPAKVKDFVVKCMVLEICPTFARRAMTEGGFGMFAMLSHILGDEEMNESSMRTWSKIYRALEQAIIVNIVNY
ncbi:unnamed protein product, partial [Cylicostephanus goldi]